LTRKISIQQQGLEKGVREAKFEVKFGCFCGASFLGLFFLRILGGVGLARR